MFGKQKDKEKVSVYHDKNDPIISRQKEMIIGIAAIVVFAILGITVYYFGFYKTDKEVSDSASQCDNLETKDGRTEGLAPYQPVVKSKISGNYNRTGKICLWTLDGEDLGTSVPIGGYCTREGLAFYNIQNYKIGLKVSGLNCAKDITLKVTGLTTAEQARQLEIKKSGVKPEDLK